MVDSARLQIGDVMHCFDIRTTNVDYFVGQDPLFGLDDGNNSVALPPPDSGIGAYLAKSWETSIRQALLPLTINSSMFMIFFINLIKFIKKILLNRNR